MTIEHSAETRAKPPLYRHLYAQVLAAIAGILFGYFYPDIGKLGMIIAPVIFLKVATEIAGITGLAKVGPIAGKASLIPDLLDFGTCRPPRGHQCDAVGCGQCLSIRPRSMPRRSPAVRKRRKNS